ncbi:MAG: hypothetical protein K9L30_05975 [Desulfobacterales bacterium]|nr:hypothetical protein [Desulfobacterales bacterium]
MKKGIVFSILFFVFILLTGMAGFDEGGIVEAPEPEINFTAKLVDQSGMSVELSEISFDGKTCIKGKLGYSELSVSFEKINNISYILNDDQLTATLKLLDGEKIEMTVDKNMAFYGVSSYGDIRIASKDINKIVMQGKVE